MIGYTSAFIGTTVDLDSFQDEFGLDKLSTSEKNLISENIVSLFVAGAFFGALFTYGLSYFIGRRSCLSIAALFFTLGAALQCAASSSTGLGILYAGRVLSGLGTGIASNTIPIYISELSPPAIRGRLVGLYELGWQIGGLVGFWINVSHIMKFAAGQRANQSRHVLLTVWRRATCAAKPQAVDHSLRRAADPLRSAVSWVPVDP